MQKFTRLSSYVAGGAMLAMLTACATYPTTSAYPSYPTTTSSYPAGTYQTAGIEYGRVVNIEYMPVGSTAPTNNGILGAVVGGVAGALLGNTIGGGSGRTAATVLGGVAGAAVGSHLGRNSAGATTQAGYRITMQSDQGYTRTFEVPATGDLRVGDRVRFENGVIYRA